MITLQKQGEYTLSETKQHVKVLSLDGKGYAWIYPRNIGEILVTTLKDNPSNNILSAGRYRIYDVVDEPDLTDLEHLELQYGQNLWQGYLLLTGLPTGTKKRVRIIPTDQIITGNPLFQAHLSLASLLEQPLSQPEQAHAGATL